MSVFDWIVSVVLFVISLSLLVTIHELGHFSMAKLFNVYCHEFSIGFGPALVHRKKEGKETYFSIRAIPFGGYVSMYGEEGSLEEKVSVPQERSLEGIKKWKKAIILSAGVILNAILAFVLIAISNLAFPRIKPTNICSITEGSEVSTILQEDDILDFYYCHPEAITYEYTDDEKIIHTGRFCVLDNTLTIGDEHYVFAYYPTGTRYYTKLTDGMLIYQAVNYQDIAIKNEDGTFNVTNQILFNAYQEWMKSDPQTTFYPDFTKKTYSAFENSVISPTLHFKRVNPDSTSDKDKYILFDYVPTIKSKLDGSKYVWDDIGLSFKTIKDESWTFSDKVKQTFADYGDAATTVFRGIGILFSGGIKNMSGIVGIFDMAATAYGSYGLAYYLWLWGLISVNLAIFNLLPFPGLDGFALLITVIEGISKKKIPTKVKGIMSAVGLILLFGLMIAIVVLDIVKLV